MESSRKPFSHLESSHFEPSRFESSRRVRYVLYARKSEEDKNRQVQSINDQIKELRALAARRGLVIVEEIREEHSAKAPGRPRFNAMLESLRQGRADGILVWSINRLLRNPIDQGAISWMLQGGQIASLLTMDKEYLPGDNVVLLSVEGAVANQFIIDLRKGTLRGIASKVEKGWFPHKAPIGYLNNTQLKTIEPDPQRFALLQRAWAMLLTEGRSVRQILDVLNEEWGFRTPPARGGQRGAGERPLALNTLYRVFTNIFYAGYFVHGDTIHQGKHQPMVTLAEFARAKTLLRREFKTSPQKHQFAFTGLIRCASCGGGVTAETHLKTLKATGETRHYTYYRCVNKHGRCDKRGLSEAALQHQIAELLGQLSIPEAFAAWARRELERRHEGEQHVRQLAYTNAQQRQSEIERHLDTLLELRLQDVIDDATYASKRACLVEERQRCHLEVARLEEIGDSTRQTLSHALGFCENARAWFASGDLEVQRVIARALGASYELCDDGRGGKRLEIVPHPLLVPILGIERAETGQKIKEIQGLPLVTDAKATDADVQQQAAGVQQKVNSEGEETRVLAVEASSSELKRGGFEPVEIGSGSCQGGGEKGCHSHWGRTLNQLRTVAREHEGSFPDVRHSLLVLGYDLSGENG